MLKKNAPKKLRLQALFIFTVMVCLFKKKKKRRRKYSVLISMLNCLFVIAMLHISNKSVLSKLFTSLRKSYFIFQYAKVLFYLKQYKRRYPPSDFEINYSPCKEKEEV